MGMQLRSILLVTCMLLAMLSGTARGQEVPLVTGQHWVKSSEELKKVYLVGLANMVQVETAYGAANPPGEAQSIVARFARGLRGQTLDTVREGLNKWYASNPNRLERPVIETIWFEMVVPGLKTAK
jgi:hypothetical protein